MWETLQQKLYSVKMKLLSISQLQLIGISSITQMKNILITYFCAENIINNKMTVGVMLSITFIIGQSTPAIQQLLNFLLTAQDAMLSIERINEIHQRKEEDCENSYDETNLDKILNSSNYGISINSVSFRYGGVSSQLTLNNINLFIPFGKTTAIVGKSGCGKTTLFKLLLKYYEPDQGSIYFGDINSSTVSHKWWWSQCGIVQSDGYIFSSTIAKNVAITLPVNETRLDLAINLASLDDFIYGLPLGKNTKIGNDGINISSGQKQRILISRAVYKQPAFYFFDEATSALDAKNETL